MKRRTKWVLPGDYLTDDSARQADVETACWGFRSTTGHYGCTMMLMMMNADLEKLPRAVIELLDLPGLWRALASLQDIIPHKWRCCRSARSVVDELSRGRTRCIHLAAYARLVVSGGFATAPFDARAWTENIFHVSVCVWTNVVYHATLFCSF